MRRRSLTLAELDDRLDGLAEDALHQITRPEYERLFGANDVALGRLRNLAKIHSCMANFTDNVILFRKTLHPPDKRV